LHVAAVARFYTHLALGTNKNLRWLSRALKCCESG
jgi:hypothetical protein